MRILPAVDIRGGRCVNLVQGDYGRETVFADDPVRQAVLWRDQGAELVHIVDLDGARAGRCCIEEELRAMVEAGVRFEVGGGIRDLDTIERLVDLGAARVILGTAAHNDPALLDQAAARFGPRLVIGIDANAGRVALDGWADVTQTSAVDFARQAAEAGAGRIIYTDILSDGMMKGPNIEATREVAAAVDIPVTVSGGMSALADIEAVRGLERDGVDEVIIGRALYLKAFTLPEALALARAG
jgi:phosphoribosylformimino-5-aminoimidazole carboxamide ribotide isomerase